MDGKMPEQEQEFGVFWGPDLRAKKRRKNPVIEHLLYEKDVVCISADPGTGKSILLQQMLFNLTTGTPFLGAFHIPRPFHVLYVQTEGDREETEERIQAMCYGQALNDSMWAHIFMPGLTLNTTEGIDEFLSLAKAPKIVFDVIIIDPLYTTVKGSMKDDSIATDWIRNVRKVRSIFPNCSILIAHHDAKDVFTPEGKKVDRKKDVLYGSRFWQAFMSYNYKLYKETNGVHKLYVGKIRTDKAIDVLELKMIEPIPLMYVFAEEDLSVAKVQIYKLLQTAEDGMIAKELIVFSKLSKAHVYRILSSLVQDGKVRKDETGIAIKYFAVKEATKT